MLSENKKEIKNKIRDYFTEQMISQLSIFLVLLILKDLVKIVTWIWLLFIQKDWINLKDLI